MVISVTVWSRICKSVLKFELTIVVSVGNQTFFFLQKVGTSCFMAV